MSDKPEYLLKVSNLETVLGGLTFLKGRTPDMDESEFSNVFSELFPYRDGGIYLGSFQGESAWERHSNGDEVVQCIKGQTQLYIIDGNDIRSLEMKAGEITVVPQGFWHKFTSEKGVTVMTVTPGPTDHSDAEDPRDSDIRL